MPKTLSISARLLAQALDVPYYLVSDLTQVSLRLDERGGLTVDDPRTPAISGARLPAEWRDQLQERCEPVAVSRPATRIPLTV